VITTATTDGAPRPVADADVSCVSDGSRTLVAAILLFFVTLESGRAWASDRGRAGSPAPARAIAGPCAPFQEGRPPILSISRALKSLSRRERLYVGNLADPAFHEWPPKWDSGPVSSNLRLLDYLVAMVAERTPGYENALALLRDVRSSRLAASVHALLHRIAGWSGSFDVRRVDSAEAGLLAELATILAANGVRHHDSMLIALTSHPDPRVRSTAVAGLRKVQDVREERAWVRARLCDDDAFVALGLAKALKEHRRPAGVVLLYILSNSQDCVVRSVALGELFNWPEGDSPYVESLGPDRHSLYSSAEAMLQNAIGPVRFRGGIDVALRAVQASPLAELRRIGLIAATLRKQGVQPLPFGQPLNRVASEKLPAAAQKVLTQWSVTLPVGTIPPSCRNRAPPCRAHGNPSVGAREETAHEQDHEHQ
jgi:hypothetical protein